ncbi:MAG: hypothetical protein M5R36_17725 [Deltaproteobacteria bacterium]|nr:hypothetical protein [Deltaproteobacteria bacterium]
MAVGKDYRKERDSVRGAALFYLTLMRNGAAKLGGAKQMIKATFRDLGVTAEAVEAYIDAHRDDLETELSARGA